MNKVAIWSAIVAVAFSIAACSPSPETVPGTPLAETATPDAYYQSQGGGEPRSFGYWLLWNSCAPDNQSELAASSGGRVEGSIIMDDLLADPGVILGDLPVVSCQVGINLLQGADVGGAPQAGDLAYELAAQLLTAQLNLAVSAEYCPAVEDAVQAGQLLLLSLDWDGQGRYLVPATSTEDRETAAILIEQLANYNAGLLCE